MRRCYLPASDLQPGQTVSLPGELVHYLGKVLRLTPGDRLELFDGDGLVAEATLKEPNRAEILSVQRQSPSRCRLTLIQGLAKGDKLELVLQKGTELGVSHFVLVPMAHSIGRLPAERQLKRLQRWQKIVQEASRQCGQNHCPRVTVAAALAPALQEVSAEVGYLLWEQAEQPLPVLSGEPPGSIAAIVGPEGGIPEKEVEVALQAGYLPIRLGPRILRTETAGLATMSILQYLYGDLAVSDKGVSRGA